MLPLRRFFWISDALVVTAGFARLELPSGQKQSRSEIIPFRNNYGAEPPETRLPSLQNGTDGWAWAIEGFLVKDFEVKDAPWEAVTGPKRAGKVPPD